MSNKILRDFEGLVAISWNAELEAIYLKWHTEFDEGNRVIEAVKYALSYVAKNNVKHWWVDLSTSKRGLKESDQDWVQTEFGKAIAMSSLSKLAMTPPLPETGQDISWLDDWEADTNARYSGKIDARLVSSENDVRVHLGRNDNSF